MGNLGFFKCDCMLFGLCNAQATFQRLMQNCLGELNLTYCLLYLDDVIVFSRTAEEHLQHLHVLFDHFQEHNLRIKPAKCEFFWEEINYLAHHISREGVMPSKESLKAVAKFTLPNLQRNLNLSELGRALSVIHQRVCMYHATITWTSTWERCQ